jgi:cold shock CspA family protein/ribosome-associated translation inhibitor RaiA
MQVPIEANFRDLTESEARHAKTFIAEQVARLERMADDLISCRVAVSKPQQHQRTGNPYRVNIRLTLPPGHELVVSREPGDNDFHDQLATVLRDSFHAIERQLKDTVQRRRQEVKAPPEPVGFVVRLFKESGYGFLQTLDGDELYFHRNSVLHDDFDRVTVGTQVRYDATQGDKGPQATSVQVIDKPGVSRMPEGEVEQAVPQAWKP